MLNRFNSAFITETNTHNSCLENKLITVNYGRNTIKTFWQNLFFANEQHLNFLTVLAFSNFHHLQNIFGAPKHDNLNLLSLYEIMSLANFEILSSRKFENQAL